MKEGKTLHAATSGVQGGEMREDWDGVGKKTPLYFHVPLHDGTNSGAIFPQIPYVFLFSNCMDFSDWTLYTEITHVVPFPLVVFDLM